MTDENDCVIVGSVSPKSPGNPGMHCALPMKMTDENE
jgi:hypothetical protein